jgi:hypothetical protein
MALHLSSQASVNVDSIRATIAAEMMEWWPAGGQCNAIFAAKKGWLLGADIIRETLGDTGGPNASSRKN